MLITGEGFVIDLFLLMVLDIDGGGRTSAEAILKVTRYKKGWSLGQLISRGVKQQALQSNQLIVSEERYMFLTNDAHQ